MRPMKLVNEIEFRPVEQLDVQRRARIREIRNQAAVRKNMYTSHEISLQEHENWLNRIENDPSVRFFGVILDNEIVGGIALNSISGENRRADWAFYLAQEQHGNGVGSALEFKFLDFVFSETEIEKLNCEVLDFNRPVVKLHKRFGFVEEGTRRDHIRRDGECYGVLLLGITKLEWAEQRKKLTARLFR